MTEIGSIGVIDLKGRNEKVCCALLSARNSQNPGRPVPPLKTRLDNACNGRLGMHTAVIQLRNGPHSGPAREYVQKYIPPAVGKEAAISAKAKARKQDIVLTMVHDVTAA